jgi:hypothetical protein
MNSQNFIGSMFVMKYAYKTNTYQQESTTGMAKFSKLNMQIYRFSPP